MRPGRRRATVPKMNYRKIAGALLALNWVLICGMVVLVQPQPRSAVERRVVAAPNPVPAQCSQRAAPPSFQWGQLESADYPTYIANLRSIGCPEATIRDIIIADVNKTYAGRFAELSARMRTSPQARPDSNLISFRGDAGLRQLKTQLYEEKRDVLWRLLGVDIDRQEAVETGVGRPDGVRLDCLPIEKRSGVNALLNRFDELDQAIRAEAEENDSPPDWQKLKSLHEQREQELAQLLTATELEQFELQNHPAGKYLRDLVGFTPSEEQFREIFRLLKAHEDKFAFLDPDDELGAQQKQAEREQVNTQIEQLFGEPLAAEYRRATDDRFRDLVQVAQQYGAPADSAAEIYALNEELQQSVIAVQSDPAFTDAQKDDFERVAQERLAAAMRRTLGERAYGYCVRRGLEQWLGEGAP